MIFRLKRKLCGPGRQEEALNDATSSDGDLNQGLKLVILG